MTAARGLELACLRCGQLAGLVVMLAGVAGYAPLAALGMRLARGEAWSWGEAAGRIAAVAGPVAGGFAIIAGIAWFIRHRARRRALQAEHPAEPWRWRDDWNAGRIRLSNWPAIVAAGGLALVVGTVIVPFSVFFALSKPDAAWFGWLFGGGSSLVAWAFIQRAWQNRAWNTSELVLETVPGVIGGSFAGRVHLQTVLGRGEALRVSLRCERLQRRGKNRHEEVIWREEYVLDKFPTPERAGTTLVPVSFAVPRSCRATDDTGARDQIQWFLTVTPREEVTGYEAAFEVPVFETPESRADQEHDARAIEPYLERPDELVVADEVPHTGEALPGGGWRMRFGRYERSTMFAMVIWLAITGGMVAAALVFCRPIGLGIMVGLIPGLLFGVAFGGLLEMLLWTATITCRPQEVRIESGMPWGRRSLRYTKPEAVRLECAAEDRSPQGKWFQIRATATNAKPVALILRIDGRTRGEAALRWLQGEIDAVGRDAAGRDAAKG